MASGITLEETFKIKEMSSISTLEFAWDNAQWGTIRRNRLVINQPWFCVSVARTNKLELLKWIREEKKCGWSPCTVKTAAKQGNLEMVKYCIANQCPLDRYACACAAEYGHLETLKYLHEEVKAPWSWTVPIGAAGKGHLHILEYLVERKYDEFDSWTCRSAAMNGHFDCLKFLHETAKAPWDSDAVRKAHENNHHECLQYLLDKNCPLPEGWSYDEGVLIAASSSESSSSESSSESSSSESSSDSEEDQD